MARLVKMPKSLSDAIRAHAGKLGVSDSDVIRDACAAYIGITNPTVHGNTKYNTDQARLEARRERQRVRRNLAKILVGAYHLNGNNPSST